MLSTVILIAVLAQVPDNNNPWWDKWEKEQKAKAEEEAKADLRIADIDLTVAVEDFVSKDASRTPPEPFRSMIDKLATECWKCRETATNRLQKASEKDWRWLLWGRKHNDQEVRTRCNTILKRIIKCPDCTGTGKSKFEYWDQNRQVSTTDCEMCSGKGTLFRYTPWD